MQASETPAFERTFQRLCAGFDTPPTPVRKDAYWRSFGKLSLLEFAGLCDLALVESTFTSMPTVGALWELHRKVQAPVPAESPRAAQTLAEQLCGYVVRQVGARLSAHELARPWSYVYREWRDGEQRCAECTGVVIERDDGVRMRLSVEDMRSAEVPL